MMRRAEPPGSTLIRCALASFSVAPQIASRTSGTIPGLFHTSPARLAWPSSLRCCDSSRQIENIAIHTAPPLRLEIGADDIRAGRSGSVPKSGGRAPSIEPTKNPCNDCNGYIPSCSLTKSHTTFAFLATEPCKIRVFLKLQHCCNGLSSFSATSQTGGLNEPSIFSFRGVRAEQP